MIVNTYNRADSLDVTLRALRCLNYSDFEVIVVNGPSPDHTEDVIRKHSEFIRVGRVSDRNLSVSRNVGIEMAAGDIVVFLDDDAVPYENWLDDIVEGYDSDEVGAVGGSVFDYTGYKLQYRFNRCDRLANAQWDTKDQSDLPLYPGCSVFPYVPGGNGSFRRELLIRVGGFDEQYDYYLDETDVCVRIIDAGYTIRQLSNAYVYHRSLPNHIRSERRITLNWYPIVKNQLYFALKNAPAGTPFRDIVANTENFVARVKTDLEWHRDVGNITQAELDKCIGDMDSAMREGMGNGLCRERRFYGTSVARGLRGPTEKDVLDETYRGRYKPVAIMRPKAEKLTICYLTAQYPPGIVDGIGRYTYDAAQGLAALGHSVHVLTKGGDLPHNTVDIEDGVWVHRLIDDAPNEPRPDGVRLPDHLWNHSARMLRELKRLSDIQPIDAVEAPIWDSEGLAAVLDGSFRVVTGLHTPVKVALQLNPDWVTPGSEGYFDGLAEAEIVMMTQGAGIRSNSEHVANDVKQWYNLEVSPDFLKVVPLGMVDTGYETSPDPSREFVEIFYAGRFEKRKGADVLLRVIPRICQTHPNVRFTLAGQDSALQSDGRTMRQAFEETHRHASFMNRVSFLGKIPDEDLKHRLANCDIFVAPSRYESFGLVFIEAMMFGKPVVGCRVGGMPEVIEEFVTGMLAEPGDEDTLVAAISCLVVDEERRAAMGRAGRARFLAHFTREKLAARLEEFWRLVIRNSSANSAVRT